MPADPTHGANAQPEQAPDKASDRGPERDEQGASVLALKPAANKNARRNRNELEFLPAALEIMESPPSPVGRIIVGLVVAFFVIAFLWAYFGHVDIVAVAPGRIVPSDRVKVIQPLEDGIVRTIRVEDGQRVAAGETLIELDPTEAGADRERLSRELASTRLEAARLKALTAGGNPDKAFAPPPGADPAEAAVQRRLLRNQWQEHRAMLDTLQFEYDKLMSDHAATQASIDMLNKTLPLLQERTKAAEFLAQRGNVARFKMLELQQSLIEQEENLTIQRHRRDEALAAISATRERRRGAIAEFRRENLQALSEAERQIAVLEQELIKASRRSGRQRLTAPVDGVVQQLAVHTVGGVVTTAQQLMVIVPAGARLEVEAMVANKDIGFVADGQEVEIKVETFAFTKYGLVHGTVMHVSRDAVADENIGLVYPARLTMDRATMLVEGRTVALSPGMAVTAEIKTGERRLIEFVLAPLLRYKQEGLRER